MLVLHTPCPWVAATWPMDEQHALIRLHLDAFKIVPAGGQTRSGSCDTRFLVSSHPPPPGVLRDHRQTPRGLSYHGAHPASAHEVLHQDQLHPTLVVKAPARFLAHYAMISAVFPRSNLVLEEASRKSRSGTMLRSEVEVALISSLSLLIASGLRRSTSTSTSGKERRSQFGLCSSLGRRRVCRQTVIGSGAQGGQDSRD
ncbi:hypothetical protein FIBSPDRAFT_184007 [Athelia psychrophila]|uniref:Uncharacterized protein n=1 Tax=Athelia psychrophila TaxID=1759441 RepID=A0A166AEW7_9AGAM|nr:hypothetical protein FIBSPDRAFT_184007 [Fibularhizoctonia sp. CBS 109695]